MKDTEHINVVSNLLAESFPDVARESRNFRKKLRFPAETFLWFPGFPPLLLFTKTEIVYLRIRDLKF